MVTKKRWEELEKKYTAPEGTDPDVLCAQGSMAHDKFKETIDIDPHKIYTIEFIKDFRDDVKGEKAQVIGTYFAELMLNEAVKEIPEEEFDKLKPEENKHNFKPDEKYYIKVITNAYPSILKFGEVYQRLGSEIPTYCTKDDLEIISKEEYYHTLENNSAMSAKEFDGLFAQMKPQPKNEEEFETIKEAEEFFNKLSDMAKVLMVKPFKSSEDYKPLAFYKPDITLKEQKEFDKKNEKASQNASFMETSGRVEEDEEKFKPEITLPNEGKSVSTFAEEVSDLIKNKEILFFRPNSYDIVEVGKIKIENEEDKSFTGFINITPKRFITLLERYANIGIEKWSDKYKEWEFKEKSLGSEKAGITLASQIVQEALLQITRIFTAPIPIIYKGELTFPKKGYDRRFSSWMGDDVPQISQYMELKEAKDIIYKIFKEFCFKSKQDYTNAIAALLTPYLRGLFSNFNVRTPVFFYVGNRERVGKDYLAGVNGIIHEGQALQEPPISTGERSGNENEELRKKITSVMIAGRKRIHFSNNKGFINNAVFEGLVTSEVHSDRKLGGNEIITLNNEMDFSLSGNVGVTYTPDFANRCIFINLFYPDEDINARKFEKPDLHLWVKENRDKILSALFTLIQNWIDKKSIPGTLPFTSFPEWSKICGGIMEAAKFGNPCKTDEHLLDIGGDRETTQMKQLFEKCYELNPDKWLSKNNIMTILADYDIFNYFDLSIRADQTRFGLILPKFIGRSFSEISLSVDDITKRTARQRYMFSKEIVKIDKKEIFGEVKDKQVPLEMEVGNLGNLGNLCNLSNKMNNQIVKGVVNMLPSLPTLPPFEPKTDEERRKFVENQQIGLTDEEFDALKLEESEKGV